MDIFVTGTPLDQADAAVIMLHGRGSNAQDILTLAQHIGSHARISYVAPEAEGGAWYPNRFVAPVASNEPWLSQSLEIVATLYAKVIESGIHPQRVYLLGFSQGACLALEFVARNPRRYGGVFALSGALIENGDKPRDYVGLLIDTPVLLGCSDIDGHIPLARVERSAQVLAGMGATVDKRIYPNMGHTVNADELSVIRAALELSDPE
jgi:predicted esterase